MPFKSLRKYLCACRSSTNSDHPFNPDAGLHYDDTSQPEPAVTRLNPVLRALLEGVYDEGSQLYKLQGLVDVLEAIWGDVRKHWQAHILQCTLRRPMDDHLDWTSHYAENDDEDTWPDSVSASENGLAYAKLSRVHFPAPSKINVNMMPFIMNTKTFKDCRLPKHLEAYWKTLIRRCPLAQSQIGKVGYLTIHESYVEENSSQRRPGIHTESPGVLFIHNTSEDGKTVIKSSNGDGSARPLHCGWGFGAGAYYRIPSEFDGGLFFASNRAESCRVWSCQIKEEDPDKPVICDMGDIEHLREFLPHSTTMAKNTLYWLTDRTPHESLPLKTGTHRQFFRLVTSDVSVWFEDHSTVNPLGVLPDPTITRIVKGSKFDKDGVVLVRDIEPSVGCLSDFYYFD